MALKKSSKKVVALKSLTMEAYKEMIDGQVNIIDFIPLNPTNGQDEYNLGLVYKATNNNVTFPFNRSAYMLFIKKIEVDLSM